METEKTKRHYEENFENEKKMLGESMRLEHLPETKATLKQ